MTRVVICAFFALTMVSPTGARKIACTGYSASNVKAIHAHGQTFITWDEDPTATLVGETYRIYRSDDTSFQTTEFLSLDGGVTPLEIPEDSGNFFTDRYYDNSMGGCACWGPRHSDRLWIPTATDTECVPVETGLLVWTIDAAVDGEGDYYYGVTVVDENGDECFTELTHTTVAEKETEQDPRPVEVDDDGCLSAPCTDDDVTVYVQYMDPREWNVTFNAPNERNEWYGESAEVFPNPPDPDNLANTRLFKSIQYAYPYVVAYPNAPTTCNVPDGGWPVTIKLHGRNNTGTPKAKCEITEHCSVEIRPYDIGNSWYYGFSRDFDYRQPFNSATCLYPTDSNDRIVNYTEQRILRMLYDLQVSTAENLRDTDDLNLDKVYVRGFSMGASGTLAFATRYPKVFAAAHVNKGMTDYMKYMDLSDRTLVGPSCPVHIPPVPANCGTPCMDNADFWKEMQLLWGDPTDGLEAEFDLPGFDDSVADEWDDILDKYNGDVWNIWKWQRHRSQVGGKAGVYRDRHFDDMVPFGVWHGYYDDLIPYCNQAHPVYPVFEDGRRCMGVFWNDADHKAGGPSQLSKGMPTSLKLKGGQPFYGLGAVKNESVPGFSDLTRLYYSEYDIGMCPPYSDINGEYFTHIEWRPKAWNTNWGCPPIDEVDRWEMSFRMGSDLTGGLKVDITPRRLQHFVPKASHTYVATNEHVDSNCTVISSESVTVTPVSGINGEELLVLEDVHIQQGKVHRIVLDCQTCP